MPDPHIYIGQWEWHTDAEDGSYWRAPGGDAIGLLEYRSLPQSGIAGGIPQGFGLFVYDGLRAYPELELDLGNDIEARTTLVQRSGIEGVLNLSEPLVLTSVLEIVNELSYVHADPTGQIGWKPLRTGRRTGINLHLGGWGKITDGKFSESHPAYQQTLDVFQADYRRNFADGMSQEVLRKWTGAEQIKLYGRQDSSLDDIIPPEYRSVGSERPATIITDGFPNLNNWTEIDPADGFAAAGTLTRTVNNAATFPASMRHDTSLSSDDHYTEIEQTTQPSSNQRSFNPATRFAGAAETAYFTLVREINNDSDIYKVVTGTNTVLQTGTFTSGWPQTVRLTSTSADQQTISIDSVDDTTVSNGDITGNVQVGVIAHSTAAGHGTGDDFEAADLAVGGRIMSSLVGAGGLAGPGGIAGKGGGLAG